MEITYSKISDNHKKILLISKLDDENDFVTWYDTMDEAICTAENSRTMGANSSNVVPMMAYNLESGVIAYFN